MPILQRKLEKEKDIKKDNTEDIEKKNKQKDTPKGEMGELQREKQEG
jgi:hypothetical protein